MNNMICKVSIVLLLYVGLAAAADTPLRKASTILSSPFVWPNDNANDMVANRVITANQLAFLQTGAGLPWETQQSNKKLCAEEQWATMPARIELKVGETFPVANLVFQSSAFGDFYYDAAMTRKWKYASEVAVFDKTILALRALKEGESELLVDSLCKSKRLKSPMSVLHIPVIVTPGP